MLHVERLAEAWMWLKLTEGSEGLVSSPGFGRAALVPFNPPDSTKRRRSKGRNLRGLCTLSVEKTLNNNETMRAYSWLSDWNPKPHRSRDACLKLAPRSCFILQSASSPHCSPPQASDNGRQSKSHTIFGYDVHVRLHYSSKARSEQVECLINLRSRSCRRLQMDAVCWRSEPNQGSQFQSYQTLTTCCGLPGAVMCSCFTYRLIDEGVWTRTSIQRPT